MNPKAKKFRIRRAAAGPSGVSGPVQTGHVPAPEEPAPLTSAEKKPQKEPPLRLTNSEKTFLSPAEEIENIKQENLTGRQLRIARREAQRHGLNPSSDLDAVRILRRNGFDPFKRADLLSLVTTEDPEHPRNLPAAIRHAPPPSSHVISDEERVRDILKIQQDLAKRRRHKMTLLLVKLMVFVIAPTLLAGYYYYAVATPMYGTQSEFVIQQAEAPSGSGLGGLFAGTGFATTQDSITVQSYLNSRDAMMRLDRDHGFKSHFQQENIDPIQRLAPDATNEAAYSVYQKRVKIGFDPTEGIVKMEVVAASPEASLEFSKALIGFAEEQVDQLTQRLREDQMKGARQSYQEAEVKLTEANRRVLQLQEQRGVVSAESELAIQMQQISSFEMKLKTKQLDLAQILDNPSPNPTKVALAKKTINRIMNLISQMRSSLTDDTGGSASLAKVQGELVVAKANVATRQLMLSQSLQLLETARVQANRQVRYLSLGVKPVAPDEATYPRAFENTLLAFLIFGGFYLMLSLTASILREQISA